MYDKGMFFSVHLRDRGGMMKCSSSESGLM
jgi:hypothetical protein